MQSQQGQGHPAHTRQRVLHPRRRRTVLALPDDVVQDDGVVVGRGPEGGVGGRHHGLARAGGPGPLGGGGAGGGLGGGHGRVDGADHGVLVTQVHAQAEHPEVGVEHAAGQHVLVEGVLQHTHREWTSVVSVANKCYLCHVQCPVLSTCSLM